MIFHENRLLANDSSADDSREMSNLIFSKTMENVAKFDALVL